MFKLRRLEDRIVLDGAGVTDALGEVNDHEVHDSMMHDYAQNGQDIQDGDYGIDGHEPLYTADGADSTPGGGGVNVLVISSDINDADDLANAAKDGVIVVRYDASGTTMEDLSGLIRDTLDGREAETIAFAAHNPELVTSPGNADQQAFWQAVGDMLSEEGRIDLLACNVIGDQAGQAFVAKIEELSGADVAASADPTGNEAYGGDWVLESDGVDIQSTYFDAEKLEGFDGVLQNTAPVITTNKPLDISAEESSVIDENFLLATDPDSADWAGALKYTLSTVPYNGSLFFDTDGNGEINGNETALEAGDTFTQAQVYTDNLTYLHDGANDTVETFQFNVTDSAGATTGNKTFTINVTQNVNPVIVVNEGMTVDENGSGVVADLKVEDRDETSDNLEYTLVTIPTHGTLWFDLDKDGVIDDGESKIGIPGEGESSFTQSQIDEGIIAYEHNGKYQGPLLDGFSFTVKDDKTAGSVNGVFRITVDEVNDAPAKMQVGEITALDKPVNITSSHLNFTDADNSPYYLTYTLETLPEHGELYLIDPGEDGLLNTYDDTISYLGKGNTFTQTNINFGRLYFDRSSANSYDDIQDSFTFKVSDPDGTHAENQDDGTDIFTFDITVGDLNEAPYLFLNDDAVINEDSSGKIETLQTRDPDKNDGPENLTYRITELGEDIDKDGIIDIPFYGTLFIDANNSGSLDEGEKWLDNDSDKSIFTFTQEDIDNGKLVYTYDSSVGDYGRTHLKFEVYDDGDTDGSVDEFGDKWAQSTGGTLVIRIFNENDAPLLDRNELLIMDEPVKEGDETVAVIDTSVLNFTDVDNSPGELTYKVGTATTAGTLYLGDEALIAGSTFTQADIDSGKLKYEFDYANNEPKDGTDDSFTFTVEDAGTIDDPETEFAVNETDDTTTFTFNIEVNNQNDLPVLENNTLNIETFQKNTVIGPDSLKITDIDEDDPGKLKFTLNSNWMSQGRLFLDGDKTGVKDGEYQSFNDTIIGSVGQSFTQENINDGDLIYDFQKSGQPDASEYASFNFTYTDGNPGAQQPDQGFETFNIKVYGTNNLPTYTPSLNVPVVNEGNTLNLRPYLDVDDVETTVTELVYTITTLPEHGELQLDIGDKEFVKIEQGDTFTHLQVLGNKLRYESTSNVGADEEITEDLFKFELRDSDNETTKNETETFNINIKGVFSNPEFGDDMDPMEMDEDETKRIESDNLMAYDPDYEKGGENYYEVTYTLTGKSSNQSFLFIDNNNDEAWDDNDTKIYVNAVDGETQFKQTDINDGNLYCYNYSEPPDEDTDIFPETFSFTIEDTDTPNIDEYTFNIDVTANENDIPMPAPDTSRNITGVYEGGKKFVEPTDIMFTDGETEDQDTLKYTLVDAPDYGDLYFDEDIPRKVNAGDSFSLSELTGDERMYYQHNGAEGSSDIFTIKVTNLTGQSNSADINVDVISLNDAPVLALSEMYDFTEGDTDIKITEAFLRVTDADNTDSELTYKITSSLETDPDPQNSKETFNGVLKLGDEVLALDSEFTQQDINDGKLSYTHDGTEDPLETFTFTVTDSAGDETEEITGEFKINITSENDPPVVYINDAIPVDENAERIVIDHNFLLTTDPDSPKSELVYTITTAPLGTLQYSDGDTLRVISKDGSTESTFTQAELSSGNILYIPNGDE
ncbi:MAG: DUF4347 domain-containing protein, partial [Bacteroidetes bacterium]|nr:DUF4347 domain-containing protein [Bacteroidota bacterium]